MKTIRPFHTLLAIMTYLEVLQDFTENFIRDKLPKDSKEVMTRARIRVRVIKNSSLKLLKKRHLLLQKI